MLGIGKCKWGLPFNRYKVLVLKKNKVSENCSKTTGIDPTLLHCTPENLII